MLYIALLVADAHDKACNRGHHSTPVAGRGCYARIYVADAGLLFKRWFKDAARRSNPDAASTFSAALSVAFETLSGLHSKVLCQLAQAVACTTRVLCLACKLNTRLRTSASSRPNIHRLTFDHTFMSLLVDAMCLRLFATIVHPRMRCLLGPVYTTVVRPDPSVTQHRSQVV